MKNEFRREDGLSGKRKTKRSNEMENNTANTPEPLTISDLGYVEEMRQRMGFGENDASRDKEIESMEPFARVRLIAGWYLGNGFWADTFKEYCASQGLYLTTNPDAEGVIS
jgi:hypothetical protein